MYKESKRAIEREGGSCRKRDKELQKESAGRGREL